MMTSQRYIFIPIISSTVVLLLPLLSSALSLSSNNAGKIAQTNNRIALESHPTTTTCTTTITTAITTVDVIPQPINEIIDLSVQNSAKLPGSDSYRRAFNRWSNLAMEHVRANLSDILPISPDQDATTELGLQLGLAADLGTMPSFGHDGARAGYALNYFCRVRLLADIMFAARVEQVQQSALLADDEDIGLPPSYFGSSVEELLCSGKRDTCKIGSLGGGPGFDFVAAVILATQSALENEARRIAPKDEYRSTCIEELLLKNEMATTIQATVYEYEKGWSDITPYMEASTQQTLGGEHTCDFAGCDITLPLTDPANSECLRQVDSTDVWICSYCVAENAVRLRDNNYVFFAELFQHAKEGALFIFTETTHRLWPELVDVATKSASCNDFKENTASESAVLSGGFDVAFPRINRGRGKAGFQLALRKRSGATLGSNVELMCSKFRRDNEMHEQKITGGWSRQKRKVRGAKVEPTKRVLVER